MKDAQVTAPVEVGAVVVAIAGGASAHPLVDALSSRGFHVVTTADIASAADVLSREGASVVIVDDRSDSWLRDVSDLLILRPWARPLALTDDIAPAELLAAVSAGVAGFVSPSADDDAIVRTVRAMIDTGVAIPRGLVAALVEELRRGRGRSVDTAVGPIEVTDREWEILQLLLQRRSTKEIADRLYVSVGTVRSHISALGRKLGAADRSDTIRLLEQRPG